MPASACRESTARRAPSVHRALCAQWPRRIWILMVVLLWTVGASLHADTFTFSGDRTEVVLAEGRERTLLEGNARVVSNAITLTAQEIELSGADFRYATLRSSVQVRDADRDILIVADELSFDRSTENTRARGDIIVTDNANDLLLRGGYLETRDGGDLLFVQAAVRVFRDDLTARAQFLRYRRDDEVLELSGFPVVFWKGDEYRASRIVLNLATEEIELQGQVEGEIVVEDEDEDEDDAEGQDSDEVTPDE